MVEIAPSILAADFSRLGEQVRAIVLDPSDVARGPIADALLFNAARSQHVIEVIRPALLRGEVVICDRYASSSVAYQGYGSGVDLGRAGLGDLHQGGAQGRVEYGEAGAFTGDELAVDQELGLHGLGPRNYPLSLRGEG